MPLCMKPFEYFDHTADTLFRAYGKDFDEALANAILAVYNVIVDTATVKPLVEKSFKVSAEKRETLIYKLFEELLFLLDTESFLGCKVKQLAVRKNADRSMTATVTLLGDTQASKYDVFGQIKAPTYSQMEIGRADGKVFIQAVLDI